MLSLSLLTMNTKLRILYWKEIPIQIQTQDDSGHTSVLLDPCFQEAADSLAMFEGSFGTDDYLDGWEWTEPIDVEGSAGEATERISLHYNASFPTDLVSRLKNLHMEGKRDPTPGSIDDWFEQS